MEKKKSQSFKPQNQEQPVYKNIDIEKLVPGSDGLARIDGKVIFVAGALPGENVDMQIISQGKKFSRARVIDIHSPSEDRNSPFCVYYGQCGGCNLQHLSYEKQLEAKAGFVREHFQKMAGIRLAEEYHFQPSTPTAYRNRIQLHKSGRESGFKKKSSDSIIPIKNCPLLVKPLNAVLKSSLELKKDRETFFADQESVWRETENNEVCVKIKGKPIHFHPSLFFQSNLSMIDELVDYCLAGLGGQHAMDLYAGVGLFSAFLKDTFSSVTGIEMNPAVEKYYHKNMGSSNFDFYPSSLEDWIQYHDYPETDLVLVDPPRSGLTAEVRQSLCSLQASRLIYVSCDPVTQARDIKDFIQAGYSITDARGFDFYPHTHHMENVVRLELK